MKSTRYTAKRRGEGGARRGEKRTREAEPVARVNQRARGAETSRLRHAHRERRGLVSERWFVVGQLTFGLLRLGSFESTLKE